MRINLSALERFENDSVVSIETLIAAGVVKNPKDGVKVLGCGADQETDCSGKCIFRAAAKIEALGGKAEVI
ncbi:MAG: uL15 family ribosomal protein [Clostridia bacterium]